MKPLPRLNPNETRRRVTTCGTNDIASLVDCLGSRAEFCRPNRKPLCITRTRKANGLIAAGLSDDLPGAVDRVRDIGRDAGSFVAKSVHMELATGRLRRTFEQRRTRVGVPNRYVIVIDRVNGNLPEPARDADAGIVRICRRLLHDERRDHVFCVVVKDAVVHIRAGLCKRNAVALARK